jgi:hypothetical protein
MAISPILVENKPPANVTATLFTVPSSSQASGTVFCVSQSDTIDRISVGLVPSGNIVSDSSWICYRSELHYGQSVYLQQISIDQLDNVVVVSENGTTNFIFTGQLTV